MNNSYELSINLHSTFVFFFHIACITKLQSLYGILYHRKHRIDCNLKQFENGILSIFIIMGVGPNRLAPISLSK